MAETLKTETESMRATAELLEKARGVLEKAVADVANSSASPAAESDMDEAKTFMTDERTARNQLAEYLTRTADGAGGYTSAMTSIATVYSTHSHTSVERIQALLKQDDGPVPIRGGFVDWSYALQYQHDHPGDFQRNEGLGGPPPKEGN